MSIAHTLLLLNDDPTKPLNGHFNDALSELRESLLNAIQYISSDNVIVSINDISGYDSVTVLEKTMKHGGTLTVKSAKHSVSANADMKVYVNGVVTREGAGKFTFEKNDIVKVVLLRSTSETSSLPINFDYVQLCGSPVMLDF